MLDQNLHRKIMYECIHAIFQSSIGWSLAFKWWTLCYFLYELPRFSTDLDFDMIDDSSDIWMEMEKILLKYGTIKDKYDKKSTLFYLLDYGADHKNIKVELSKKSTVYDRYEIQSFFGTPIRAMTKESMFANKMLALDRRLKNRDIFDVWYFFSKQRKFDDTLIEFHTNLPIKDFLKQLREKIIWHYKPTNILAEIWDLISDKQKEFMKNEIVRYTVWYIDFIIQFG